MTVADDRKIYEDAVSEINSFISNAHSLNGKGNYKLAFAERAFITESAFLKIFISWERFLENVFVSYLVGESSIEGHTVERYSMPIDREHAHRMIIGPQKYFDWSMPERIIQLAKIHFKDGEPFSRTVNSISSELYDLKTIRNSAAHLSSTTISPLNSVYQRKVGKVNARVTVYDLLMANDTSNKLSILNSYIGILEAATDQISKAEPVNS